MQGQQRAGRLAQAASGAIADDGAADLLRGRETGAHLRPGRAAQAALNHDHAASLGVTLGNVKEFATNPQAQDVDRSLVVRCRVSD
jgi:hypothetical protein